MHRLKRRKRAVVGVLATAATAIFLLPVSQASAVTIDNACINTANPAAASFIPIDMTGTASPTPTVLPGGTVTLSNITETATVPGAIFLAGYRLLGPPFIVVGSNSFPVSVTMVLSGTNTSQGTQTTNAGTGVVTTTITDPTPADRNSGDEAATPGSLTITFADQTWTAGASGTINFREDTVTPLSVAGTGTGGMVIDTVVGGIISVRFSCSPGTVVEGADPSTIVFTDPAPTFASTMIFSNTAPTANAGPDQTVHSLTNVTLDGTASSDPDPGDSIASFAWTQTGGANTVTLSGANTATPTFTAPAGNDSLTFQLQVCDTHGACSTDSVTVNVTNATPTANAGPDQPNVITGNTVTLDGSASSDPDGDALTYLWTAPAGITLSDNTAVMPTFVAPDVGTTTTSFTFTLQVCDTSNACSTDSVVITVHPQPVVDASMNAIINGPTRTAAGDKALVAKVTNLGTGPLLVCDTDISWAITVNGTPTTGNVSEPAACSTLSPGGSHRFKATWTYGAGEPGVGATVVYTATVSVANDSNAGNNSDTETRTAK
jgi:hypothetical protein